MSDVFFASSRVHDCRQCGRPWLEHGNLPPPHGTGPEQGYRHCPAAAVALIVAEAKAVAQRRRAPKSVRTSAERGLRLAVDSVLEHAERESWNLDHALVTLRDARVKDRAARGETES